MSNTTDTAEIPSSPLPAALTLPDADLPDLPESAAAEPAPATVLGNIQSLLRDKTRFTPEDVTALSEQDELQPFELTITCTLEALQQEASINGHFSPGAGDHRSDTPSRAATDAKPARLAIASSLLKGFFANPDAAYNGVKAGLWLAHDCTYWYLDECSPCRGKGRVTCHTCNGSRQETCWQCHGGLFVTCDAFGCCGSGRVNCSTCNGSGHVHHQVAYTTYVQVPTTTWNNGISQTTYHTEARTDYRTEQRTCTAFGCQFGKIQCVRCTGTGQIRCPTCASTGKITCRTCSGLGDLMCKPCAGSGRVGHSAWVDVHIEPAYRLTFAESCPDSARQILEKFGLHEVAAQASSLTMTRIEAAASDPTGTFLITFSGSLRIVNLAAQCNGQSYELVAYGTALKWLTTDSIVEDLLRGDLKQLQAALSDMADDSPFSCEMDGLLANLKNVAASELNTDIVLTALTGEAAPAQQAVLSDEYRQEIQKSTLGTLRQIYLRTAKRYWWQALLATLGVMVGVWLFFSLTWAAAAASLVVAGAHFLFARKTKEILTHALGDSSLASRAAEIAGRSGRVRLARGILLGPSVLGIVAVCATLPMQGWWSQRAGESTVSGQPTASGSRSAQPAQVASALALRKAGKLAEARLALKALAERGVPEAYGPYGWMILSIEGLPPDEKTTAEEQHAKARPWIDKGLKQNDIWAQAAQGMVLTHAWGVPRNMDEGLALLKAAGNAGHDGAMHALGLIYVRSFHVEQDLNEARKWFQMAADQGLPADIYNIGLMDWRGHGIARPDRQRAMALWRQAAAQGESRAIEAVRRGGPPD